MKTEIAPRMKKIAAGMSKGRVRILNLLSICNLKNQAIIPTMTAADATPGKIATKNASNKIARIVQISNFFMRCLLTKTLILSKKVTNFF